MSTRAVYTFRDKPTWSDEDRDYHVYKHNDGYPEEALKAIINALDYAWPLPRFEADEFSASFIAANKGKGGGDCYLTEGPQAHGDLVYKYVIELKNDKLWVTVFNYLAKDNAWEKVVSGIAENIYRETQ